MIHVAKTGALAGIMASAVTASHTGNGDWWALSGIIAAALFLLFVVEAA